MRLLIALCLPAAMASLHAAEPTALEALKIIPKEKAARLARIEARDGTPNPERWYLIVQDPDERNGLREFVVANNEVVASRTISQFADTLKPEDVIGGAGVKVDSDRLARLAREYARANDKSISKMNYELKKEGQDAVPIWKVSCFNENNQGVGELSVTAGKGNVIAHDGFAVSPETAVAKKPEKFDVDPDPQVAKAVPVASPISDERPSNSETRHSGVGHAFGNFGNSVKHFFTGH